MNENAAAEETDRLFDGLGTGTGFGDVFALTEYDAKRELVGVGHGLCRLTGREDESESDPLSQASSSPQSGVFREMIGFKMVCGRAGGDLALAI